MATKTIKINDIEILLRKNSRSRYMNISVKPFVGVRITLPERVSFHEGEKLAHEKILWIEEQVVKMKRFEKESVPLIDENVFQTRNHRLELIPADISKISIRIKNGLIVIKYPSYKNINSAEIQTAMRKGIEKAYREEAVEYLPKRINDLADKFNLPFKELFIKNIRSRWGSCSGRDNINLSIHLMRLPDHLIDYVILHELAHTKVKNHSKKFWSFLDSITPNARKLDKELKKFRIH